MASELLPDPPEAATFVGFALEGTMPDESVVRLTIWTPRERGPEFYEAAKAALKAALLALYPSCPRAAGARMNFAGIPAMPNLEPAPPAPPDDPLAPAVDPNHPTPPGPPRPAPPVDVVVQKPQPKPFDVPPQPDDSSGDDCGDPACRD